MDPVVTASQEFTHDSARWRYGLPRRRSNALSQIVEVADAKRLAGFHPLVYFVLRDLDAVSQPTADFFLAEHRSSRPQSDPRR
jgi:hypothetical protein